MKIDNIRLLRLSRSAPSLLTAPGAAPQDGSEVAWFSLFDYFDGLVVRKGDTLDYRACFGLDQPASTPPLVSSEYLTLVSLAGEEEDPAADAEHRLPGPVKCVEHHKFRGIPEFVWFPAFRLRRLPVACGIDIRAARQQESVAGDSLLCRGIRIRQFDPAYRSAGAR